MSIVRSTRFWSTACNNFVPRLFIRRSPIGMRHYVCHIQTFAYTSMTIVRKNRIVRIGQWGSTTRAFSLLAARKYRKASRLSGSLHPRPKFKSILFRIWVWIYSRYCACAELLMHNNALLTKNNYIPSFSRPLITMQPRFHICFDVIIERVQKEVTKNEVINPPVSIEWHFNLLNRLSIKRHWEIVY